MSLHHLWNGSHLCARRRWLSNTFHTSSYSLYDRERLEKSNTVDLIGKLGVLVNTSRNKTIVTEPSIVENSKIRQHLNYIESTKHSLSLGDVERFKPDEVLDVRHPSYAKKYRDIHSAITLSFTKTQLRRLLSLYGLSSPSTSKGKALFAESLMKHWGLRPLTKVQEERTNWIENSERLYPMSPAYAFLFMGSDGANLFSLAKRYNVQLSFISEPLGLKIQGLKGALKQLDGYLKHFEEDITSETAQIPHGLTIRPQVAQSISRHSGAYVEASHSGKLFITYRKSNPTCVNLVKRLAVQAASEQSDDPDRNIHIIEEPPDVCATVGEPDTSHAFYPFFPPQKSLNEAPTVSLFRLRRVGQWLRANAHGDDAIGGSLDTESVSRIKLCLLDKLSTHQPPNSKMVVEATPGYVLFSAPSEHAPFKPPVLGNVKQNIVLDWAKENSSLVLFKQSVPKNLLMSWPNFRRRFQRIVYKTLPTKAHTISKRSFQKSLILELLPQSDEQASQTINCTHSIGTHSDILLPSRAMDMRISVSYLETIATSDIPRELQLSTKGHDLLVDPPATVTLDGVPYILSSTSQIQQDYNSSNENKCDVVIETTMDPENGQSLQICKVLCANPSFDWKQFLQQCDRISMIDSKALDTWFQDSNVNLQTGT